jgi:hypothetical protein
MKKMTTKRRTKITVFTLKLIDESRIDPSVDVQPHAFMISNTGRLNAKEHNDDEIDALASAKPSSLLKKI